MNENTFYVILIFIVIVSVPSCMAIYPHYGVWKAGMNGQAQLKEAEQNRKIAVQEAEAKMESAKLEAIESTDKRNVALGKTNLQQGFMWAIRGVAQPTTF